VALELDVVAAVALRRRGRGRKRPEVGVTVDAQVRGQREGLAAALEVGEQPVGPGLVELHVDRPAAVGRLRRVEVLEGVEVAPGDDEVHPLLVLDLEVLDGAAAAVDDAVRQALRAPAAQLGVVDDEAGTVLGDGQAADLLLLHAAVLAGGLGAVTGGRLGLVATVGVDGAAGEGGATEGQAEDGHEPSEPGRGVHDATS
jgi:hypothetical protein